MEHCKNCGHPVREWYCSHCGQKVWIERISFSFVWHEIFHFFTHMEKGFLYTSWRMLRSPGQTVIEYIEGKRKRYQSPVSYFLIWVTIFLLTLYGLVFAFGENAVIDYKEYFGPTATTKFAIRHLSFMLTLIIPIQAFYLFVLVTHRKYNYFESLVAALFAIGSIIMLQFVFAVLAFLVFSITGQPVDLRISDLFKAAFFIWFTASFLKVFPVSNRIIRGLAFVLLAAGTFTAWRIYVVPEIVKFFL